MERKFYTFDTDPEGLIWLPSTMRGASPEGYCRTHQVPVALGRTDYGRERVYCPIDQENFPIRNDYNVQRQAAYHLINRDAIKDLKLVRIDSEGTEVLAKERNREHTDYWVDAKLQNTPQGVLLIVQAGKRDKAGKKVQLFIDPPRGMIRFDISEKDQHPSGLFTEVRARFKSSESTIQPTETDGKQS